MSNRFMQAWNLAITPLAPVHVGTGEDFDPTNYVIDGETLYAFSPEAALRVLPEAERRSLLTTVNRAPDVDMIKQVQAFFHRNRERLIPEAEGAMPVLPTIAAEYQDRVGKTAQRETGGREIINQLRIERTYSDLASRRPILPGSSLKGAIRTALLDRVNGGNRLTSAEKGLSPNQQNRALQQRLFAYKQFDQDPMRLVNLGDARDQTPAEVHASEIRYAVNRKRHEVKKDGREVAAQAENLRQVLECVPALRPRAFGGSITMQDLGDMTGPKLPDTGLRWTLQDLAAACNAFYRPIFERELAELKSRGYLDPEWRQAVTRVLETFSEAFERNRAFLLRVGRHSGAQSVTLNGVRNIRIMRGRGEKPEFLPEAKTYWLAAREIHDRRHLVPFGWLLIETVPAGQSHMPWPEEAGQKPVLAEWWDSVQRRRAELRAGLEAEQAREAQRKAADEQRREQEEKAHREQAALQARLESLTDEQRAIEELKVQLDADRSAGKREAGGLLANRLAETIRGASGWGLQERQQLAVLAEEIYAYIGWGSSKKKKEKRARIQALRESGG